MQMKEQATTFGATPLGYQYWMNPDDKLVYATVKEPTHGFNEDRDAFAVFNPQIRLNNVGRIKTAMNEGTFDSIESLGLPSPYIDPEFQNMYENFAADYAADGRQRMGALASTANTAVQILNVFPKLYGLKERKYAARNLTQEVGIPNLVLDIDTIKKYSGMVQVGELQLPIPKEVRYSRNHYEANKYGLIFEISEEAILKNIHNPIQDSITIAATKVEQRASYDIVTALENNLTNVAALGDWGSYIVGTDHSATNPKKDISRIIVTSIEQTGVGGTFNRVGIHSISYQDYETNSYVRGTIWPAPDPDWDPSVRPMQGFAGVGLVQDYFIPQGVAYLLDVGDETCAFYLQGPTRVASKTEEISGSQIYGIFDFHLAIVNNTFTGRRVTAMATPVAPA